MCDVSFFWGGEKGKNDFQIFKSQNREEGRIERGFKKQKKKSDQLCSSGFYFIFAVNFYLFLANEMTNTRLSPFSA